MEKGWRSDWECPGGFGFSDKPVGEHPRLVLFSLSRSLPPLRNRNCANFHPCSTPCQPKDAAPLRLGPAAHLTGTLSLWLAHDVLAVWGSESCHREGGRPPTGSAHHTKLKRGKPRVQDHHQKHTKCFDPTLAPRRSCSRSSLPFLSRDQQTTNG